MQGQQIDTEGYLADPMEWNESAAEEFSRQENIKLTEIHWGVIRYMRSYYEDHLIAPDTRYSIKYLSGIFGKEARNKLFELFPYGYVQQACKIAGMKRPRNWSTG